MTSIQTRLTIWLLGSVVVLFGLNWVVTSRAPRNLTEEYIATRLEHDAENLVSGISFNSAGKSVLDEDYIAPIYFRYGSGHYYLIRSATARIKSPSLGDEDFNVPFGMQADKPLIHMQGPNDQPLLVWVAHFNIDGNPVSLAIGEDLTAMNRHITKFRLRFGLVTLILLVALIVIQRVIVRFSLKPIGTIGQACRQLETGEMEKLPERVPEEIQPLVIEINRLMGVTQQRLVRSREALGNLAHGLKTPLAVLSQIIEENSPVLSSDDRTQAQSSISMIKSIIDRELKRARLAGPASAGQLFSVDAELPSMIDLLKKVYADRKLDYELVLGQVGVRFGDREDMLELVGNLLDNASKWAVHRVRFSAGLRGGLWLSVEDDGPGVDDSMRDALTQRGVRYDESVSGHGLGLSIIQDVVAQYGGSIQFLRSKDLGGLQVVISFPGSTHG